MKWTLATFFLNGALQLLFLFLVSRYVELADYGNFSLFLSLTVLVNYLLLQPSYASFDRFFNIGQDPDKLIIKFNGLIVFLIASSLIFTSFIFLVTDFFHYSFYVLLGVYLTFSITYSVFAKTILLRLDRYGFFCARSAEAVGRYLFPILGYLYLDSVLGLVIGLCLGFLFSTGVGYWVNRKTFNLKVEFDFNLYRRMFIFSYPLIYGGIASWGLSWCNRYFIEHFESVESVGLFSLITGIAGMAIVASQIFSTYVNPKVLQLWESDEKGALKFFFQALSCFGVLQIAVVLIGLFCANFVIFELAAVSYEIFPESSNIFVLMLIANVLMGFTVCFALIFSLMNKMALFCNFQLASFFINICGNLFIEDYGLIGAAISSVVAYLSLLVIMAWQVALWNSQIKA